MSRPTTLPRLTPANFSAAFTAIVIAALLFCLIPLTQMIQALKSQTVRPLPQSSMAPPPDLIEPPTPPIIEEPDPEVEDLVEEPKPPTLDQLLMTLDPSLRGIGNAVIDISLPSSDDLADLVQSVHDVDQPPEATHAPLPRMPHQLHGIDGEVHISCIVEADGTVSSVRAVRSSHRELEHPAINQVRRWRFRPAVLEGREVAVRVTFTIRFTSD